LITQTTQSALEALQCVFEYGPAILWKP